MKHRYMFFLLLLAFSYTLTSQTTDPIAAGQSRFLGNIHSNAQITDFTNYWNQVTPENAGKWGSVERTRDVMNWTELDAAYALAKENGFPFKLHVLIWGNQQPSWMESLPTAEQREEIEEWFSLLAERYNSMDYIEVVNEPINDPPSQAGNGGGNYIGALGGTGTTGYDWIIESFRLARQYFPDSKLLINEYNIVNNTANVNKYLQIINLLKAEDLIDGIGVQAHAFSTRGSADEMTANLNALSTTDLPIYVTELDIDGPTDEIQLADYQRIFPVFWEHPAVEGITLWGWRPGLWRNEQKAYLVDTNGQERSALAWLREYVSSTTGLEKKTERLNVSVFPNPVVEGKLFFESAEPVDVTRIFDATGKLVIAQKVNNSSFMEIPLNLTSGVYTVQLFSGRRFSVTKIVVR